ncbi:unnamed protein product [Bemisia tabaci]|uniref:Puratrophin-1 n=1 Tax=Bemisia tabaci TaxID=7038 RepID=A0A9P0G3Q9_BEMTA|nr:unnamed protein product [Bemisia tabaci]
MEGQDELRTLPSLLRELVVSVELAFERVADEGFDRDEPDFRHGHPRIQKRDSAMQTGPCFDEDDSIPHIDSDDNEPDHGQTEPARKTSAEDGRRVKPEAETEVQTNGDQEPPAQVKSVQDILLTSGVYLPGTRDLSNRPIIVYDASLVAKSSLDQSEIANVFFHYATLPTRRRSDSSAAAADPGFTLIVLSGTSGDSTLDLLDKSLTLVTPRLKFDTVLVWRNTGRLVTEAHRQRLRRDYNVLPCSKVQYQLVSDLQNLHCYLPPQSVPSECGGPVNHDQLEWVEFFKECEPFINSCHLCGKKLVTVLRDVGTNDDALSRGDLYWEFRGISHLLSEPELIKLCRHGPKTLAQIKERSEWLPDSEHVKERTETASRLFSEIREATARLQELHDKRREKLRELAHLKSLADETSQVLSWLRHKGETSLKRHSSLANNLPGIKQQEQDFEKFYFISMRHLDKAGDLLEEAGLCGTHGYGLKELARSLKQHLRGFTDRLEDTRERLEDTSRCFDLVDRAWEWALDAMKYLSRVRPDEAPNCEQTMKQLQQYLMAHPPPTPQHFEEMIHLATKLGTDKIIDQCKVAQSRCEETLAQIQACIGENRDWNSTPRPARRCSLPATAPTGFNTSSSCACWDSGGGAEGALSHIQEESCFCPQRTPLHRSCTWQYPTENFDEEDKSSAGDNTTESGESGTKSNEDVEDNCENPCDTRPVPPVSVNSHLHCSASSLEINAEGCGVQTLKAQKTLKLILREMITTERDYVKSLEYVIENYISELVREDIPQALRGQRNVIFGNIEKIYEFHSQHFLQELEKCEHFPLQVGQVFLRHEKKFYLYALYNKNKPKSDSLMSEYGTKFFKAKQLELKDSMDLGSYLLKPVQRMGKYALLLQQLMKASRTDIPDIREAETMVRFQLRHGNDLLAMDSLRDCDVNLKEQGRLLRQNEFLVWQGKGKSKKCLRQVFLFEELILFSKARRFPDRKNLDLYIYKHSIKMSDIGLTAKVGDSDTKFEIWFRKRKPNDTFTLQSMSNDIKQAWTEELSSLLWKQAMRNREIRLAEMISMGIGNKPCLDIRPSADQINDRSISIAQLNKTPRFRNSIALTSPTEHVRKRPHSIISMSSSSSSSCSGGGGDARQTSQCSSAESGIVTDWSNSSVASESNSSSHHMSVKL